jgi:hypothetical protein
MASYEIIQVEKFGADWVEKYFSLFSQPNTYADYIGGYQF